MNLSTFQKQRNHALLSLSADKIMRIFRMDGRQVPQDKLTFWLSVHKARTAIPKLPHYARMYSKKWLNAHKSMSLDDGELGNERISFNHSF